MKFSETDFMSVFTDMKGSEKEVLSGGGNNIFSTEKFWKADVPKKGKNTFRIRLLPTKTIPWQLVLVHSSIKGASGWINEMCPESFPKNKNQCPICNEARRLYATGDPTDEKYAKPLWRKKYWVANIQVVKDSRGDDENEGKIFMFRFGTKLHDKFESAISPQNGEEQVMFIHPTKGYDLSLVCKTVSKFPNYDDSTFVRDSTSIGKNDKEAGQILDQVFDLTAEVMNPKNFKSLEDLEKILNTNIKGAVQSPATDVVEEEATSNSVDDDDDIPDFDSDDVDDNLGDISEGTSEGTSEDDDFLSELEGEL